LRGENRDFTIIELPNGSISFEESGTRAYGISVENLTVYHNSGQTIITNSENCKFINVKWKSEYVLGDTVFVPINANCQYVIPTVTTGGSIVISGTGVSSPVTQTFSTSFSATLGFLQSAVSAVIIGHTISIEGSTVTITANSSSATSSSILASFTVQSQTNNLVPLVTVIPDLFEYTDGADNVNASVYWENNLFSQRTTNIRFIDCRFESTPLAVECRRTRPIDSSIFDTVVDFKNCEFFECDTGIYIEGITGQGNHWTIEDSRFEEIANNVLYSTAGRGTKIHRSRFLNCGNGTNSSSTPTSSIIYFGESFGNTLVDCSSNRHQNAEIISLTNLETRVEFLGVSKASLIDRNYSDIYISDAARPLCQFSCLNKYIYIEYKLRLDKDTRTGQILMVIDTTNTSVEISDVYNYSGGGTTMTNFKFSAQLLSNSTFDDSAAPVFDIVMLKYENPVSTGRTGTIEYNLTYGV